MLYRRFHRGVNALLAVGNARQQRGHHHPGRDALLDQTLHRLQAGLRAGRPRFGPFPNRFVDAAHAENHLHIGGVIQIQQHIGIPPRQYPFGGDGRRVMGFGHNLENLPGQPILRLGRLVRVGRRADGHRLPRPARRAQFLPQHFRGVHLGENPLVKLAAGVHPPKLVGRPGVAVTAGVAAPPIGIERPAKGKARDIHPVQQGLAGNFLYLGFSHNTPPASIDRTKV